MRIFLFLLLVVSCYSNAKSKVLEEFQFYTVSPDSKKDLLKALNKASPIRDGDDIFHGHTEYRIDWRFWWKPESNQCRFTKVKTTLKLRFTMPQLETSKADVKSLWSLWYPNLLIHEQGHGALAKSTAHKIDQALLSIGSRSNCKLLVKEANKLAYQLMDELKLANEKYDKDTNHGKSQGAWLHTHL